MIVSSCRRKLHGGATGLIYTPAMIVRSSVLIAIASLVLTGCGLKGPLYLPDAKTQPQSENEREKKERSASGAQTPPATTDTTSTPPSPSN